MTIIHTENTMTCKTCGGFGFYSETKADGSKTGRKCPHIAEKDFILQQDLEIFSGLMRFHDGVIRPLKNRERDQLLERF